MDDQRADRVEEQVVYVHVTIAATPETVWSFFTDATRFAAWIGAFAGGPPLPGTAVEPRVGGAVRVCYPGQGEVACGEITEMRPRERIVFTWGYEKSERGLAVGASQVEITLTPVADGTRVELRHTGLPTETARREHLGGWKHYLSMLARNASDAQHAEPLARIMDTYFQAWREADDAKRLALLAECCDPAVRVRTAFACTDGIDELSRHIANGLRHMPGMTLVAAGPVQHVHGHVRVGWSVRGPGGQDVFRGENVGTLAVSGKIRALVSFAQT